RRRREGAPDRDRERCARARQHQGRDRVRKAEPRDRASGRRQDHTAASRGCGRAQTKCAELLPRAARAPQGSGDHRHRRSGAPRRAVQKGPTRDWAMLTRSGEAVDPARASAPDDATGTAMPVALVSGGRRRLGAAIVTGFLARNFRVATCSRRDSEFIAQLMRTKAANFHWAAVDGRDRDNLRHYVRQVADRFGRVDVLVNNAGVASEGVLPTMRTEDIANVIEVNLTAAVILAQASARVMLLH